MKQKKLKDRQNDGQIISYGFVECQRMTDGKPNNAYTTENKKVGKLTLTYIKDITKNLKKNQRVYYAVVQHAGKNYAIPIKTETKIKGEKPSTLQTELKRLSALTSLVKQDVTVVNSLITVHNKKSAKSNQIPPIKSLEDLTSKMVSFNLKKGVLYTKTKTKKVSIWEAINAAEKSIMLDLNNTSVFHSPKPLIDFTTFSIGNIKPNNKLSKKRQAQVKKDSKDCI